MNWSGGKDAALAFHLARQRGDLDIVRLLTVSGDDGEVPMHGVPLDIIMAQAESIGVGLEVVRNPEPWSDDEYSKRIEMKTRELLGLGCQRAVFGDIWLDGVRERREKSLSRWGIEAVFPLWGMRPSDVVATFLDSGIKSVVTCVDGSKLHPSLVGRQLDRAFFDSIPGGVDPCGENGEYHSLVVDGPMFSHPIDVRFGEPIPVLYEGCETAFWHCDVSLRKA